jgi:hypothetical protein
MGAGVGDRHDQAARLQIPFSSAAAWLLPARKLTASDARDGGCSPLRLTAARSPPAMTVAQITPPASRPEAVASHTYCLPVVRELPGPVAGRADDRTW